MQQLIKFLVERLKLSEEDAIVAALFGVGGFTVDAVFFPAGMPPFTVTFLSASTGLLLSRMARTSSILQNRILAGIDKQVKRGNLTEEQGAAYKKRLIAYWLESKTGINFQP